MKSSLKLVKFVCMELMYKMIKRKAIMIPFKFSEDVQNQIIFSKKE